LRSQAGSLPIVNGLSDALVHVRGRRGPGFLALILIDLAVDDPSLSVGKWPIKNVRLSARRCHKQTLKPA
jgi:hypothetical protein